MLHKQLRSGMRCEVIDSVNGKDGASVGRIVRIASLADPATHSRFGVMWDCEPADGKGPFKVRVTAPNNIDSFERDSNNATFAGIWLKPLDNDPVEPKVQEREHELLH